MYTHKPKFKCSISTFAPVPDTGFKKVMADTIKIPITVKIKYLYFPFNVSFSSLIIRGIANTIKPINKELIWYIFFSKTLAKYYYF